MRNIWDSILRFCRSKAHEFCANIFYSNVTIRSFITTAFVKKVLKPQNYSNSMLPCFAMISLSSALHYLFLIVLPENCISFSHSAWRPLLIHSVTILICYFKQDLSQHFNCILVLLWKKLYFPSYLNSLFFIYLRNKKKQMNHPDSDAPKIT